MAPSDATAIFAALKDALSQEIDRHGLQQEAVTIRCRQLTPDQAIGSPEHQDYVILAGKERMIEATCRGARGQAFTNELAEADYTIADLLALPLDCNARRAHFVAGLNAVFRYSQLVTKTIHCRDEEPVECAQQLRALVSPEDKVLLVGLQPRFLETLAQWCKVRATDLDPENIGTVRWNVRIEPPGQLEDAISWCDRILATGSTLVNGSIAQLIAAPKPVTFYGVTVAAAARILQLDVFCHCGH